MLLLEFLLVLTFVLGAVATTGIAFYAVYFMIRYDVSYFNDNPLHIRKKSNRLFILYFFMYVVFFEIGDYVVPEPPSEEIVMEEPNV